MFNLFNSKPKTLRFDGLYIGSQKFLNKLTNNENRYLAIFKFNENGLGVYKDFIEESVENKIGLDLLRELKNEMSKIDKYEPFEGISKYEILQNDEIQLKFLDPNYRDDYIDENNFHIWYGKILSDKLILSRDESFYSYNRNCVVIERRFSNLEFAFLNLK